MLARPDPNTFELLPWRRRRRARRPACSATSRNLDGDAVRGRPALRAEAQPRPGPRARASRSSSAPEMEFFYFAVGRRRRRCRSTRAGYFDLTTLDVAERAAQADDPHARGDGHPGRVLVPRGRPEPARDRPALHRRADDGRQRHDVPARREGGRASSTACYATFMPKPIDRRVQGSGMHTHLSLFEGDVNAFHDPGDEYGLSKVGQALHRRAAAPRPRDHRGHQPVGELLQAARSPATRRRSTSAGPATTARRSCGCRSPKKGKAELDPHRVPRARPGVQPVPRVLGDARRRAQGHRGGLRAPARGDRQHLRADAPRSALAEGIGSLPQSLAEALDVMERLRARRRGARRARLRVVPPQQAAEWRDYKAQVTPFELDRYLATL